MQACRRQIATLLAVVAGCGGGEAPRESVVLDTVEKVPVVRSSEPTGWQGAREAGPVRLRIGSVDGPAERVFGRIADIAVDRRGRVLVADGQALHVRFFDGDGAFLFQIGGEGEGPGEFRAIDGIAPGPGGDLWVRDPRLARATRFAPDGAFVESLRLERPYMQFSDGTSFWVDEAGRLWDRVSLSLGFDSPDSLALVRYGERRAGGDRFVDTVVVDIRPRPTVDVLRDGVPAAGLRIPYSPRPVVEVAPSGVFGWASGAEHRIELRSADGGVTRRFAWPGTLRPVTDAMRDSALAALRARADTLVGGGTLESFTFPDHQPAVARLLSDVAGRWWVGSPPGGDPTAPPVEWDVLEPGGAYLGRVRLPAIHVTQVGDDFVAGVERDDLGVERAVVHALPPDVLVRP